MLDQDQINNVIGSEVYGSDGSKIGKAGQVYLDDQTGRPEWVTVHTGLFGTNESFVPVADASFSGDRLTVPFDKDKVKGAPNVSEDGHLSEAEEQQLYEYYGLGYSSGDAAGTDTTYATTGTESTYASTGTETTGRADTGGGYDTSGPTTDDAMTLSEEQVNVGTRAREAGRARLRKYVDTDTVTETVPVTRERAVLEREPITDANIGAATSGPDISEEEHEVVLTEEVPVVEKEVRPVERVRLGTESVTEQQTVTEEVRKERVDADGDIDQPGPGR